MPSRRLFALLLLSAPVVAALLLLWISGSEEPRAALIVQDVGAYGAIDTRFDGILGPVVKKLQDDMPRTVPVTLNAVPTQGGISVLVVDASKLPEHFRLRGDRVQLSQQLRLNARAIHPDTVLLDSTLVALSIVSILADHSLIARRGLDSQPTSDDPAEQLRRQVLSLSSADQMRFKFVRDAQQQGITLTESAAATSKALDGDSAVRFFYMGMMPLIGHEFGHLMGSGTAPWPQSYNLSEWLEAIALAPEERADSVASQALDKELERGKALDRLDRLVKDASLVTEARLLREMTLFDAFDDFRGVQPEQLFTHLDYQDCRRMKKDTLLSDTGAWNGMAVWPWSTRLPLLTKAEFDQVRSRLKLSGGYLSHPPALIRAGRMLGQLEIAEGVPTEVSLDALRLVMAAYGNNTGMLFPEDVVADSGMTVSTFLQGLDDLAFEPAVSCPARQCEVSRISNGFGHIEIMRNGDRLIHARALLRATTRSTDSIMDMAVFLRLLHNLLPDEPDFAANFSGDWVRQRSECGAATRWIEKPQYVVSLTSVPYDYWTVLDVVPRRWVSGVGAYHLVQWPWRLSLSASSSSN